MRDYTPRPGTVPYQVIRYLQRKGTATTAEVFEAVGLQKSSSSTGLVQYLNAAIRAGYIARSEPQSGAMATWWVGHRALPEVAERIAKPVRRSAPRGPASVWDYAARCQ